MRVLGQIGMNRRGWLTLAGFVAIGLLMGSGSLLAASEQTTIHVVVKDAKTGDPIYQAHLTLRFRQPGGFLRRSKIISYTGKSDKEGRCMFPVVTMGEVILMVTAPDHETYGRRIEINRKNQLIEVKLRKPQPVL